MDAATRGRPGVPQQPPRRHGVASRDPAPDRDTMANLAAEGPRGANLAAEGPQGQLRAMGAGP